MSSENSKKIWQAPWGYPESFAIVGGVVVIGLLLQLSVGGFDFYLLSSPVNLYVGCALLLLCLTLGLMRQRSALVRWFTGAPFSVAMIVAVTVLAILMGLTPQTTTQHTALGFEVMTACWSFVLLYALLLCSLGALVVDRLTSFRISDTSFYLNHIGLWLLLAASGLGYADMQRYIMYVNEGETQWRVYDAQHNIEELPIAITLNDFSMDFYPSRQVVVDTHSGEVMRGDIEQYDLAERYKLVMTSPEPRAFRSDVEVYTQWGESRAAVIEVNKPLRIGMWTIYQYGYDNAAGNRSQYSSFELVYDRWIVPVYIGVILMMLGSLMMIISGRAWAQKQDV